MMKWFALLLFVMAVMGIVGNGDLEEAERAQAEYCENVASEVWPDYRGIYAEVCE